MNGIDDLARAGVKSVDDLAKLGVTLNDLKKMGISAGDLAKAGVKVSGKRSKVKRVTKGGKGTSGSFADQMSPEEAARYDGYWKWKEVEGTAAYKNGTIYDGWYKPDGKMNYPPNSGAVPGTQQKVTLGDNNISDVGRYGKPGKDSAYVTRAGDSSGQLSLPPNTDQSKYIEYKIVKPIPDVEQAVVAPWVGDPGLGVQYKLPKPIQWYVDNGYLIAK